MGRNKAPGRRARRAVAEGTLSPGEVVRGPLGPHGLPPDRDPILVTGAGDADHRPPARPARDAAPAARPLAADDAATPTPGAALGAAPTPTHLEHRAVTVASRQRDANSLTVRHGRAYRSTRRGKNKARGESVGQPKPRASGHEDGANRLGPSQWVRTPTVPSSSTPTRNGRALARAPETHGVPMPSRSAVHPTPSPCRTSSRRPRRDSPAPYTRGEQNQSLCDPAPQSNQAVAGLPNTARLSITDRLSRLRVTAEEIAHHAAALERLIGSVAVEVSP